MPTYTVNFQAGPCGGQTVTRVFSGAPPATLECGGATYRWYPTAPGAALRYVAEGTPFDITPEQVAHKRDALRSWHRLMRELVHGTQRQRHALARSSQRIRRAVR